MAACFQFALSNPVKGREVAFNDWYGAHHLYVGVSTPGILAGQRFQRVPGPWPGGDHDFLALWELDNPPYALEQLASVKGTDRMPLSDAVDMAGIQPPTMWIRAAVRNRARLVVDTTSRGTLVLMLCNALPDPEAEAAFEAALLAGGLVELADRPGVVTVDFLTLADEQIRNNARKFRFALLIELADEDLGLASLSGVLEALPGLDAARWKAPVFRPLGDRVDSAAGERHLANEEATGHSHGPDLAATIST